MGKKMIYYSKQKLYFNSILNKQCIFVRFLRRTNINLIKIADPGLPYDYKNARMFFVDNYRRENYFKTAFRAILSGKRPSDHWKRLDYTERYVIILQS